MSAKITLSAQNPAAPKQGFIQRTAQKIRDVANRVVQAIRECFHRFFALFSRKPKPISSAKPVQSSAPKQSESKQSSSVNIELRATQLAASNFNPSPAPAASAEEPVVLGRTDPAKLLRQLREQHNLVDFPVPQVQAQSAHAPAPLKQVSPQELKLLFPTLVSVFWAIEQIDREAFLQPDMEGYAEAWKMGEAGYNNLESDDLPRLLQGDWLENFEPNLIALKNVAPNASPDEIFSALEEAAQNAETHFSVGIFRNRNHVIDANSSFKVILTKYNPARKSCDFYVYSSRKVKPAEKVIITRLSAKGQAQQHVNRMQGFLFSNAEPFDQMDQGSVAANDSVAD